MSEEKEELPLKLNPEQTARAKKRGLNRVYTFLKAHKDSDSPLSKQDILDEIERQEKQLSEFEFEISDSDVLNRLLHREITVCEFAVQRLHDCLGTFDEQEYTACLTALKESRRRVEKTLDDIAVEKVKDN